MAISTDVVRTLRARGFAVERLGGADRFATAVRVADELGSPSDVLLASGRNFPDAVTAGAAAAEVGGVVLLTDDDRPAAATRDYLARVGAGDRWAIGGPAADAHPGATALVGRDRYQTATKVAGAFFERPAWVGLARGDDFPDSLAGGALLGQRSGPIRLAAPTELPGATRTYLCDNTDGNTTLYALGGPAALSNQVITAAVDSMRYVCE